MFIPMLRAPQEAAPASCNVSRVLQSKDGDVYAFFGAPDTAPCLDGRKGAPLDQFVDAFEQHCGLHAVSQSVNDSWVPRSILGGPSLSMAIPSLQPSNPAFQNCLNFEAMEIAYPRSEALRLGLCAGLPLGSLATAWTIIAAARYFYGGRRMRVRRPPPPVPPNTPELRPRRPRATGARGYGTCVELGEMSGQDTGQISLRL